jgi:hypothetical protein
MVTKEQPVRVTLTREHRDAIYEEIESVVGLSSDLHIYHRDAEFDLDDRRAFADIVWRLDVSVRLLEQLGWQVRGDRDSYELQVDADVARFMEKLDKHMRGALEEDREAVLSPADARLRYGVTEEEWAEEIESRRRLIDLDLDGIDAARIVREAYREAVA